jgi:phage shock protein B
VRNIYAFLPILVLSIPIVAIISRSVTSVLRMQHEERMARGAMSENDAAHFHRTVEKLERRLNSLETILDHEVPGWRRKYDD